MTKSIHSATISVLVQEIHGKFEVQSSIILHDKIVQSPDGAYQPQLGNIRSMINHKKFSDNLIIKDESNSPKKPEKSSDKKDIDIGQVFENLYDDACAGEREEKEEKPKNNSTIHIPDEYGKVFEAISIYQ